MACSNSCNHTEEVRCNGGNGNGYVCIIVLYILLAIIIGSLVTY